MNCPKCKTEMNKITGRYHFTECGLDNVWLDRWPLVACSECESSVPVLPPPDVLTRLLVDALIRQEARLDGDAILFLRKAMKLRAIDLADLLGVSRAEVSRWENDRVDISPYLDFKLRMEAADRIFPDRARDKQSDVAEVLHRKYKPEAREESISIPPPAEMLAVV